MALQENQIHTIFKDQIGRDATPYEISKYSTSSPQTLANLKLNFSKLNTNQSIADYLTYSGQDSSIENRIKLGQEYGISNIGTSEGNIALLNALKSGKKPGTPPSVTGSIIPPDTTNKETPIIPPIQDNTISGSIQKASETPSAPTDPISIAKQNVDTAYSEQQAAQKAVADIDKTLAGLKKEKMDEIARSGGVVNESSMMAEILRENEPLLAHRKELVSQYTAANNNYQKAVSEKRDAEANYYKQQQLDLAKEKIDNQEQQFRDKLVLSKSKNKVLSIDGTSLSPENNQKNIGVINTILASNKFTKEQKQDLINGLNSGEDALTIIKNQAKNIMGQTEANDLGKLESAKEQLNIIDKELKNFYANGGDTSIFKGNYLKVNEKLGKTNDPILSGIATKLALAMQKYRLAVTGTAASVQEDARIDSVFPGITNGEILNNARTQALIGSFNSEIDSKYRNVLGSAYDGLKKQYVNRTDMSETGAKSFVEKSLTKQGLKYDELMSDMQANSPAGYQPALDNETGLPVFATPAEISSGKYTPL